MRYPYDIVTEENILSQVFSCSKIVLRVVKDIGRWLLFCITFFSEIN